ncbi:MAG: N-formylglutamate amidohydrolase, partial [Phycisphaerales bacterium]
MKLPLLISVPHAGLKVPDEVRSYCALTSEQIAQACDEGASEVYAVESEVAAFVTTDVACVIVDLNRSPDDRTPDGVVKT